MCINMGNTFITYVGTPVMPEYLLYTDTYIHFVLNDKLTLECGWWIITCITLCTTLWPPVSRQTQKQSTKITQRNQIKR